MITRFSRCARRAEHYKSGGKMQDLVNRLQSAQDLTHQLLVRL